LTLRGRKVGWQCRNSECRYIDKAEIFEFGLELGNIEGELPKKGVFLEGDVV
jgi:hypothetical protein